VLSVLGLAVRLDHLAAHNDAGDLDQGGACGAAGLASAPGSALGWALSAHRATRLPGSQIRLASNVTQAGTARELRSMARHCPSHGTASRALPPVASHASGYADHGPDAHPPWTGGLSTKTEQARTLHNPVRKGAGDCGGTAGDL
jgi:hypothetical protein